MALRCRTCSGLDKSKTAPCRCRSGARKWQADFWIAGTRRYASSEKELTLLEARAWYADLKSARRKGQLHLPADEQPFSAAVEAKLNELKARMAAKKLKQSAYEDVETQCRLYLLPMFGTRPCRSIQISDVDNMRDALLRGMPRVVLDARLKSIEQRLRVGGFPGKKEYGPLSESERESLLAARLVAERERILKKPLGSPTIRKVVGAMSLVLRKALRNRWVDFNAADGVARTVDGSRRRKGIPLTDTEMARLIAHTRTMPPRHGLPIRIAAALGARKGEVLALQWSDFDREEGTLNIQRSRRDGRTERPKTEASTRTVPLPQWLVEELKSWRKDCPIVPEGWMFPNEGKRVQNPFNFDRAFDRVRKAMVAEATPDRAQVLAGFRFHDLRHTANSAFARRGVSMETRMTILGHKLPGINGVYTHIALDDMRSAVETAAKPLREISKGAESGVSLLSYRAHR